VAGRMPYASARTPASTAPTAKPPSRHSRYTPTARARHAGCATSPIAASSVGYTIAVPAPSSTAAAAGAVVVLAPGPRRAANLGPRWGLLFGALWFVEMTVGNELYRFGRRTLLPYFGSIIGVFVLNILAGVLAGRIATGSLVGLYARAGQRTDRT